MKYKLNMKYVANKLWGFQVKILVIKASIFQSLEASFKKRFKAFFSFVFIS